MKADTTVPQPYLFRELNLAHLLFWSALIGAVFGFSYLQWDVISTSANDRTHIVSGDRLNNVTGLNYYVQDEWRFPVYDVSTLNSDTGGNIIFTDSLPILAPFIKIIHQLTSKLYDPFTGWLLACYVLQGISGAYLLYKCQLRHLYGLIPGIILICALPALLFRHGHVALCSHFILLLGLGLYLRSCKEGRTHTSLGWLLALTVFSLFVHAYIWAMAVILFAIAYCQAAVTRRLSLRGLTGWIAMAVAATGVTMLTMGYIRLGGDAQTSSYGFNHYSMNLLSPVVPQLSGLFGGDIIDGTGGQYEGYNYLGAGVLTVIILTLILKWRPVLQLSKRHIVIALSLPLITLLSLSNTIWIGSQELITIPLPDFIEEFLGTFRSIGRFFWIVSYAVLIGAITVLHRGLKPITFALIMTTAVLIQLLDVTPHFKKMAFQPHPQSPEQIAHDETLINLISKHGQINVYPRFNSQVDSHAKEQLIQLLHLGSISGTPVNTAYFGRSLSADPSLHELVDSFELPASPTFMVFGAPFTPESVESLTSSRTLVSGSLILASTSSSWNQMAINPPPGLYPPSQTIYPLGEELQSHELSKWGLLGMSPWDDPHWAIGTETHLFMRLPRGTTGTLEVTIHISPHTDTELIISIGSTCLAEANLNAGKSRVITFEIPPEHYTQSRIIHLNLSVTNAVSPEELGTNADPRPLAFHIESFKMRSLIPDENILSSREHYNLGTTLVMTDADLAWRKYFSGLSSAGSHGTWSDGEQATALLQLARSPETDLLLRIEGTAFITESHPAQTIQLVANDKVIKEWLITESHPILRAIIPHEILQASETLRLEFLMRTSQSPKNLGLSGDERMLALHFEEFTLSEL